MSGSKQRGFRVLWPAVVSLALLLIVQPALAQSRSRAPAHSAPTASTTFHVASRLPQNYYEDAGTAYPSSWQARPLIFHTPSRDVSTATPTAYDRFLHTTEGAHYRIAQQRGTIIYVYTWPLAWNYYDCCFPYFSYTPWPSEPHRCYPPVYGPEDSAPTPSVHGDGAWYPPYGVYVPQHPQRGVPTEGSLPGDAVNAYYLGRAETAYSVDDPKLEPALRAAIGDITAAFQHNDFDVLAKHLPSNGKIAIYLHGQYSYSLTADRYLHLTRQALTVSPALSFGLHRVYQIDPNTYRVMGIHVFKDPQGNERMVSIGFVLQRQGADYVVIQIDVDSPHL